MPNGLKKEDSAALKGVAVLMLVFHHCYRTAEKFEGYDVLFRGLSAEQVITLAQFGKICVAIFAFVSGYGLMHGYFSKVKKRSPRAIFPWTCSHLISTASGFWFTAVIFYLLYFLRDGSFQKWGDTIFEKLFAVGMDAFGISKLLGTKSLNGSWWYMSAAIVFILLFPLLADVIGRYGGMLCIAILFLLPRMLQIGFPGGTSYWSFLMIFAVGMICRRYDFFTKFHEWAAAKWKFWLTLAVLVITILLYYQINLKVFWEFQYAWTPFIVIVFCVEYLFRIRPLVMLLQYLGKHSMNIWLVHTFVRDWCGPYVFGVREFWLIPLVILVASLLISYCLDLLKKLIGYDRLIRCAQKKLADLS